MIFENSCLSFEKCKYIVFLERGLSTTENYKRNKIKCFYSVSESCDFKDKVSERCLSFNDQIVGVIQTGTLIDVEVDES